MKEETFVSTLCITAKNIPTVLCKHSNVEVSSEQKVHSALNSQITQKSELNSKREKKQSMKDIE